MTQSFPRRCYATLAQRSQQAIATKDRSPVIPESGLVQGRRQR